MTAVSWFAAVAMLLLIVAGLYLYVRGTGEEVETMILYCPACRPHRFQDRAYGTKMRVHNEVRKAPGWRCTVCGNVRAS